MLAKHTKRTGRDPVEKALEHHYLALCSLEEQRYNDAERHAVAALRLLTASGSASQADVAAVLRTLVTARSADGQQTEPPQPVRTRTRRKCRNC